MMRKTRIITAIFLAAMVFSCGNGEALDIAKAKSIVFAKLTTAMRGKNVDINKLPNPAIERQDSKLIFEFKDYKQDAWIVVIVHPDGFAEVSFDRIDSQAETTSQ